MHTYKRSTRVAELLQQEISRIIMEMPALTAFGLVTVTGVKLTDDLQDARVFYSVIGDQSHKDAAQRAIRDAIPQIRHQVALRVNLRRTPRLVFEYDTTPERAGRVFEILEHLKEETDDTH